MEEELHRIHRCWGNICMPDVCPGIGSNEFLYANCCHALHAFGQPHQLGIWCSGLVGAQQPQPSKFMPLNWLLALHAFRALHCWHLWCSGLVGAQQPQPSKPQAGAPHVERDAFICAKYVRRQFAAAGERLPGGSAQAALWDAARHGDVRYPPAPQRNTNIRNYAKVFTNFKPGTSF